jgi:hypothetical protein
MSKDEVAEPNLAGARVCDNPDLHLARRRALVQVGWAVPGILAVGLPREARAQNGSPPGTPPTPPNDEPPFPPPGPIDGVPPPQPGPGEPVPLPPDVPV